MKKRFLSILAALCLLLTLFPLQAGASEARSGSCGKNLQWVLSEDGVLTISGSGSMDNYSNRKTAPWILLKSQIQTVSIKKGVKNVGNQAFEGCGNLTKVSIPQTFTAFGVQAFQNCRNLREVNLPRGVVVIGASAFRNCEKLVRANFPNSLKEIGSYAFDGCTSLTNVAIPKSAKVFDGAFANCKKLAIVQIPNTCTKLPKDIFSGCEKLKKVTLPKDLIEIMDGAFENCKSLNSLSIPSGVKAIGKNAFANCSSLSEINLPENVTKLSANTFFGCSSLASVSLPGELTKIDTAAFRYCAALQSVTLPVSVQEIGSYAFSGCKSLKTLSIPSTIEKLGKEAFAGCTKLASLDFPGSLEAGDLGADLFKDCGALKTVNYSGSKAQWQALNIKLKTTPKINTVERKFIIRFNGNGASGSFPSKTLGNGEKYGALPTPTRPGCSFEGWYTTPGGNTRITEKSIVSLQADQILYAHWMQPPKAENIAYRFTNSAKDMGYTTKPYRIPIERYEYALGKTQYAKTVYDLMGDWDGSCFGMSTSACLLYVNNNSLLPSDFQRGATRPYDLRINSKSSSLGLTVRSFIEVMQILWYDDDVNREYNRTLNNLEGLVQAVEKFKRTGKNPIVINAWGPYDNGESGHSLVGYDIVNVNSRQSRLMVVDPNSSIQSRYITLTKNSSGKFTGWHYDFDSKTPWGSDVPRSYISYTGYDTYLNAWNNRAGGKKVKTTSNLLTINAANAVIKDTDGNEIAVVQDGQPIALHEDVRPLARMGITADREASGKSSAAFFLPCGQLYTIENADGCEDFQASLTNVDQSVAITTDAGEMNLAVSDEEKINYAELPQNAPARFEITLSSTMEEGPKTVQLSGDTQGRQIALAEISHQLYADLGARKESPKLSGESRPQSEGIQLTVDGEPADTTILAGSAVEAMGGALSGDSSTSGLPFSDVTPEDSFFEGVKYVYENDLMEGVSDTAFHPYDSVTRGQLVTILHRLDGSPAGSDEIAFTDVEPQSHWAQAICWAMEQGLVKGAGNNRFEPDRPVTRQDLLVILQRYAEYRGCGASPLEETLSSFDDGEDVSEYAAEAVGWAIANQLFPLAEESQLAPKQEATRAQAAELLARFCGEFLE